MFLKSGLEENKKEVITVILVSGSMKIVEREENIVNIHTITEIIHFLIGYEPQTLNEQNNLTRQKTQNIKNNSS